MDDAIKKLMHEAELESWKEAAPRPGVPGYRHDEDRKLHRDAFEAGARWAFNPLGEQLGDQALVAIEDELEIILEPPPGPGASPDA